MRNEVRVRKVLTQWVNSLGLITPIRDIAFEFRHSSALFLLLCRLEDAVHLSTGIRSPSYLRADELRMMNPNLSDAKTAYVLALDILQRREVRLDRIPVQSQFFDPSTTLHVTHFIYEVFLSYNAGQIDRPKEEYLSFYRDLLAASGATIKDVTPSEILAVLNKIVDELPDSSVLFMQEAQDWHVAPKMFYAQLGIIAENIMSQYEAEAPQNSDPVTDRMDHSHHGIAGGAASQAELEDVQATWSRMVAAQQHQQPSEEPRRLSHVDFDGRETFRKSAFASDSHSHSSYTPKKAATVVAPLRKVITPKEQALAAWKAQQAQNKRTFIASKVNQVLSDAPPFSQSTFGLSRAGPRVFKSTLRRLAQVEEMEQQRQNGPVRPLTPMEIEMVAFTSSPSRMNTGLPTTEKSRPEPSGHTRESLSMSSNVSPASQEKKKERLWMFDYSALCILYSVRFSVSEQVPALLPQFCRVLTSDSGLFVHSDVHTFSPDAEKLPIAVLDWAAVKAPGCFLTGVLRKTSPAEFDKMRSVHDKEWHVWAQIQVPNFGHPAWMCFDRRVVSGKYDEADEIYCDLQSHFQMLSIQVFRNDMSEFGDEYLAVTDRYSFLPGDGVHLRNDACRRSITDCGSLFESPREFLRKNVFEM